jgi:hypothetical protein
MAALRRAAVKEKKGCRELTRNTSPQSIVSKLQRYLETVSSPVAIQCWVDAGGDEVQCRSWFRTGACLNPRCKWAHDTTLSPASKVTYASTEDTSEGLAVIEPISHLKPHSCVFLRFIIIDNMCVYDYTQPNQWLDYLSSPFNIFKTNVCDKLVTIAEEIESVFETKCTVSDILVASGVLFTVSIPSLHLDILAQVLGYLDITEICAVMRCNKVMRSHVRRDTGCRKRLKEAEDLTASDASKRRKDDKRRKLKSAFKKVTLWSFFNCSRSYQGACRLMTKRTSLLEEGERKRYLFTYSFHFLSSIEFSDTQVQS